MQQGSTASVAKKVAQTNHSRAKRVRRARASHEALLSPVNPGDDFLTGAEWIIVAGLACLTTREMVVATLLLKGRTRKSIAHRLKLSPETVRVHIDRLFEKFHVQDRLGFGLRVARIRESIQAQPWGNGAAKKPE
jgi:DNA-binding NarL/FixJ family response regulator